jgi:hypothetical protein
MNPNFCSPISEKEIARFGDWNLTLGRCLSLQGPSEQPLLRRGQRSRAAVSSRRRSVWIDAPQGVEWTRTSLAVVPPDAVVNERVLPGNTFEWPPARPMLSLHSAASRADGRGTDARRRANRGYRCLVAVVASWPLSPPRRPARKTDQAAMLDGGAHGTWSSARSSGEHRHRAGMEHGEQSVTIGGASLS